MRYEILSNTSVYSREVFAMHTHVRADEGLEFIYLFDNKSTTDRYFAIGLLCSWVFEICEWTDMPTDTGRIKNIPKPNKAGAHRPKRKSCGRLVTSVAMAELTVHHYYSFHMSLRGVTW